MSNRHSSSEFPNSGRGHSRSHGELPMGYINHVLDRFCRSPRRPHYCHHSWLRSSPTIKHVASPRQSHPDPPRHHRRKHRRRKMTSFSGPWSTDLEAFKKSVQSIPDLYKSSFASASKDTLEKLRDADVLHVWETDSDIDNLLQVTSVIAKLCNLGARKEKGANATDGSMLIMAEEKPGRNNFARICQLVEYLTCANGKKHLEGTVAAFGSIAVVKGWNNSIRSETASGDAEAVVKRINITIERVFKIGNFPSGKKKIVWHHGPVIHFLLHWINNTASTLRSALYAITVTASLDLTDTVKPSPQGRSNTISNLSTLESYAKKLDVPVVFLDTSSQLITFQYLATYMCYYAYYINTFFPASLSRPHLHKAQDELVTFAFQLLGASKGIYGNNVIKLVKNHLDPGKAKKWARGCVDARNYERSKCRSAGKEGEIHRAVQIADGPFALFNQGNELHAFARLGVGPAAQGLMEYYTAAPVSMDFKTSRLRPSYPATFHILVPVNGQDLEKVTNRIQGLMMAVLERVRQEKGNPMLGDEEKCMWKAVVKSCSWALDGSKGKMPKSVEEKVKFVNEKLTKGTWGYAMGAPNDTTGKEENGVSEAARANAEAIEAYGAGLNIYGQVPQGYSSPQLGTGFPPPPQQAYEAPHGLTAPPNSPGMGQPQVMTAMLPQGYGQGIPPQMFHGQMGDRYTQSQAVGGHAHVRGSGGSGRGYPQPQSMGGAWL